MSENTRPMTTEELIAEIKNLKAYAIHERSLAAEKYTQEIHDLKHEVEAMVAENDKLSGLWSKVKDERDAFKADAAQLREALQDLYNDSIGFQDKSNWAMEKARAAIDMKQGEA